MGSPTTDVSDLANDLARMLIVLAFASTVSWVVRYRYLNLYARLPLEPQRKEPEIDLFPDTQEGDTRPGLANYLDEFLSAIKVFGYLERPVFHELTRTMQTRKLRAGETLLLEEEKGFCLVVDGLVQIFVKSGRKVHGSDMETVPGSDDDQADDDDQTGNQGYALLTEVKNGASMSSLFSILSLFTEDVQLRHDDDDSRPGGAFPTADGPQRPPMQFLPPEVSHPGLGSGSFSPIMAADGFDRTPDWRERSLSVIAAATSKPRLPDIPPFRLESQATRYASSHLPDPPRQPRPSMRRAKSVHPDILARATVDTTIAIIPASAFRRLTRVYPKATAHIVQVILTRLQRVTLATGHSYLGLTSEILQTEKRMNQYTAYELPNFLRGNALSRLKQKFFHERERVGSEEEAKGIALHNGASHRPRRPISNVRNRVVDKTRRTASPYPPPSLVSNGHPNPVARQDRTGNEANPGDLLTDAQFFRQDGSTRSLNTSLGRTQEHSWQELDLRETAQSPLTHSGFRPFVIQPNPTVHRQESFDEDSMFRASVLECMFKAIGLAQTKNAAPKSRSGEQSPRLVSYDSRRQVAVFNHAFGTIDPYEESTGGDTDSVTSAPPSAYSAGGAYSSTGLEDELRDDVEIVYFPKGSVLVEQGERNPGLYYVIDGFLDVGMPVKTTDADTNAAESRQSLQIASARAQRTEGPADVTLDGVPPVSFPTRMRPRKQKKSKSLFLIKPGGIAGYVGTVSSYRSFVDVRAKTDVYVGFLPRWSLERVVERFPIVLLTMAKRLTTLLPRLILHVDFALEWLQVNAGQVIYHQNDESDAIYIVLNGRLRLILEKEGGEMRVLGEFGQGESVGELEVLTESTRPGTLHAIRDTELARFPKSLFNTLALEHPDITIKISKIIASRMRALVEDRLLEGGEGTTTIVNRRVNSSQNIRTVAILPVTAGVPVVEFGNRLLDALSQVGTPNGVTSLNQAVILNHLGRHAFNRMGKLKLSQYLADLEEKYGMVVYVADTNVNAPWTQTCISQADSILLVGLAEGSPDIGEYERFLLGMKTTARKELVLLHVERFSPPGLTRKWLRVSALRS